MVLEQLLPDQLVKRLKGEIIPVQCVHIKDDLMLLFKEGQNVLVIYLNLYIWTFLVLSENSSKDLSVKIQNATSTKEYKQLVTVIFSTTRTRSQMLVNYLKDVSTMLAIVSAVRTRNITQHLQAERKILKLILVFVHINYAPYNSFQHVFLNNLFKRWPTSLWRSPLNMD